MYEFARPNITTLLTFEGADFFGTDGVEGYTHSDAIACLQQMLDDSVLAVSGNVEQWLKSEKEFWTIEAVVRGTVPSSEVVSWGELLFDDLRERFSEEYGDAEGDDRLDDADEKIIRGKFLEVAEFYVSRVKVWPCEHLRNFTLDSADILELVQQLRPEWLSRPE